MNTKFFLLVFSIIAIILFTPLNVFAESLQGEISYKYPNILELLKTCPLCKSRYSGTSCPYCKSRYSGTSRPDCKSRYSGTSRPDLWKGLITQVPKTPLKTCPLCKSRYSGTSCPYCKSRYSGTSRPDWIYIKRPITQVPKTPLKGFDRFKNIPHRGGRDVIISAILIAVGAILFFDYPLVGIPLVILGLVFAYFYFKGNSLYNGTATNNTKRTACSFSNENCHKEYSSKTEVCRPIRTSSAIPKEPVPKTESASPKYFSVKQENSSFQSKADLISNSNSSSKDGDYYYQEGVLFCNGNDGRGIDYQKAAKCFLKAKDLGNPKAEEWLHYLPKNSQRGFGNCMK